MTKCQKPSLQQGNQVKKFFLLNIIYLGFQIQVPIYLFSIYDLNVFKGSFW